MKSKLLPLIGVLFIFFTACKTEVVEELLPCNTINVTYSETIEPILQSNCYRCHDNANAFAGVVLEGYSNVMTYVTNDKLLGVIRHEDGFAAMPRDAGKLPDCQIEQLEIWINDGAQNN